MKGRIIGRFEKQKGFLMYKDFQTLLKHFYVTISPNYLIVSYLLPLLTSSKEESVLFFR